MNTAISKICRWVFFACLSLSSIQTDAGHLLCTDITYTYVSPNTYHVIVRWYRDCQGLPANQQAALCYSSATAGVSSTVSLTSVTAPYFLPPFPYTPPMVTSCLGGPGLGIERTYYEGNVTLPSSQTDWVLSYSTFPQNVGINQNFMYVSTRIDNVNYPLNSSCNYVMDPTFAFCLNQPAWDNFACTDADGDSLSYHLVPILDNTTPCPPAPFQNPLLPFNALQSSTPISMDSTNGSLTFTPSSVGQAMVSARVDEFRNGIFINSSTIEHVMYIISGCTITGIDEVKPVALNLHPNPVADMMFFNLTADENPLYIVAADVSGKITRVSFSKSDNGSIELNVKHLSQGIYTLRVVTENAAAVSRFVKL